MNVNYEKIGPCLCRFSISFTPDEVAAAFDRAYHKVNRSTKVPGFRKGQTPASILNVRHGEQVQGEVKSDLVFQTLYREFEEKKLNPLHQPEIDAGEPEKGRGFSYVASVELKPDIELTQYIGLPVPGELVEVSEQDIDERIAFAVQQAALATPVTGRTTVQTGDLVLVDYRGTMDGKAIPGAEHVTGALVEVGASEYLAGFDADLVGAEVPSTVETTLVFPDNFSLKDARGRTGVFRLQLRELYGKELPKVDDAFAKDMRAKDVQDMRDQTRANIKSEKQDTLKGRRIESLLRSLVEANPFEAPPTLVSRQLTPMVDTAMASLKYDPRFNPKDVDMELLRRDSREAAEFRVKVSLLLLEVFRAENMDVTQEDIDAKIDEIVEQSGCTREKAVEDLEKTPQNKNQLISKITESKAMEFLMSNCVEMH